MKTLLECLYNALNESAALDVKLHTKYKFSSIVDTNDEYTEYFGIVLAISKDNKEVVILTDEKKTMSLPKELIEFTKVEVFSTGDWYDILQKRKTPSSKIDQWDEDIMIMTATNTKMY